MSLCIAWFLTITPPYWHPLLQAFSHRFQNTTLFTAAPFQFAQGYEHSFKVQVLGDRKVICLKRMPFGYDVSLMLLPFGIVPGLLRLQPHLIFADGFCWWTLFVVLLKPLLGWHLVLLYDGSSPTVDSQQPGLRLWIRQMMIRGIDILMTNNQAGKTYLVEALGAKRDRVFVRPYLVPDPEALLQQSIDLSHLPQRSPVFLFVGQVIPRKGVAQLLKACLLLLQQGHTTFTVLIVGEGWQQQELETMTKTLQLTNHVHWLGKVPYGGLGQYYQLADVVIFPTLEDVWGTVVAEAMALGKPVLCSKVAGAAELVVEGETGYCFDPHNVEQIADLMRKFIQNPALASQLGQQSHHQMTHHNAAQVTDCLVQILSEVLGFSGEPHPEANL